MASRCLVPAVDNKPEGAAEKMTTSSDRGW